MSCVRKAQISMIFCVHTSKKCRKSEKVNVAVPLRLLRKRLEVLVKMRKRKSRRRNPRRKKKMKTRRMPLSVFLKRNTKSMRLTN